MKFNISGFNQEVLMELSLNIVDAEILRWFVDFQGTGKMREFKREDGVSFFQVRYSGVLKDLPCIDITSEDRIYRIFKKLAAAGVLEHNHFTYGGSFSTYRLGPKYEDLLASRPVGVETERSVKTTDPSGVETGPPPVKTPDQKTLLPEDSSTRLSKNVPALADPLYRPVFESFLAVSKTFSNYAKEGKVTKVLCESIRNLSPEDPEGAAKAILHAFRDLTSGQDRFWSGQPFTPSGLSPHLDRVWAEVQKRTRKSDLSWVQEARMA